MTFKSETDDLRDSPALAILPPLFEKGAKIQAHDPQGMAETARMFPDFSYVNNDKLVKAPKNVFFAS